MSSKKKRNDVGSGPGENIDIEDKINAAMDKIMKDPEEERNSCLLYTSDAADD